MRRTFRDLPIASKMRFLIVAASVLSLLVAAGGVILYDVTTVRPRAVRDLTAQADLMRANTTAAVVFNDPQAARENLATLRVRPEVTAAAIYDTTGRIFAEYARDSASLARLPALRPGLADTSLVDGARIAVSQSLVNDGQRLGWLEITYQLPAFWVRLPQYGLLAGVVLLSLLVVSLLLDRFLRVGVEGPLRELAGTARAVGRRQDFAIRARPYGRDEIGEVAVAFNEMLATVEAGEAAVRESVRRLEEAMSAARMTAWSWVPATGAVSWGGGAPAEDFAILDGVDSLTDLLDLAAPSDRPPVQEALQEAVRTGAPCEFDLRLLAAGGRARWLSFRGQPELDPGGRVARVVGLAMDITDRRRLEEQLVQSQRLEAIGRLAGGVAHDFNNLLTAILGYAKFALQSLPPSSEARADVLAIERAGQRAASLTGQLLAYARRQMVAPRVVRLDELVTGMEAMLHRIIGEDIRLVTRFGPDLWQARIDPAQFEQILLNLAVNARDAMPSGGTLSLELTNRIIDPLYASGHSELEPGRYVVLEVSDTGIGMDPETRSRIFEPFFTTKEQGKGTGLGLAVCYGIVRQAGGSIVVYSEPGQGSVFRVLLPRAEAEPELPEVDLDTTPRLAGSETVLLVEDERWVRELAARSLRSHGYRVVIAASGEEALGLAEVSPPDVVVTDVVMPGINGRELAERLQRSRPDLKVVYMSGYAEHSVVRQGVLEDGIAFVGKPFEPDRLAAMVREVLDRTDPDPTGAPAA